MTSYFRVQDGKRNPADLLDPENWISYPWGQNEEAIRHGVSVCGSREDLARYLAGTGIPFGGAGWVLVELDGEISDDEPFDADLGEILVNPSRIVSATPIDDELYAMISDAYDAMPEA